MDFKHHIFYQDIMAHSEALDSILDVFERELSKSGKWDRFKEWRESRDQIEENQESVTVKDYYSAKLFYNFFNEAKEEDLREYINLGRKEFLARKMLEYLNLTKDDPQKIRELLKEFCDIPVGRMHVAPTVTLGIRVDLISQFISDHLPFIGIAKSYINMRDIENVLDCSISSTSQPGLIGGKAAGMILSNRIIRPTLDGYDAELDDLIAETDSYYLKSCVAVDYVSRNNLQECHSLKYLSNIDHEDTLDELKSRFMRGKFPEDVIEKLKEILEETDGAPLIVRSSSYLEDGVGYSFCGKYDSVFVSNRGTPNERLQELQEAIKEVYLSLYGMHAIEYRRDKNLLDYNERMAVLIQKVVGSAYGKYFFPAMGMVGFSKASFCWNKRLKTEDGMIRMVMGLGTRAVDRVGDDYPRMVFLTDPQLRPEIGAAEQVKYSQKQVDVLNLETRQVETINFVDLVNEIKEMGERVDTKGVVSILEDGMLKDPMLGPDTLEHGKAAITFNGVLKKKKFTDLVKMVLQKTEEAYGMPVDMEFAYNDGKLYILQCRHLAERGSVLEDVEIPEVSESEIVFTANKGFTNSEVTCIPYIIYVDEDKYNALDSADKKQEVARVIGRVNRKMKKKSFILIGPGRWGSSNLDLGVPVKYNDINNSSMLVEVAREKNGVTPEVSYGTHFFQDLVEADIIPLPLYPDDEGVVFDTDFFNNSENLLLKFEEKAGDYADVVKIIDIRKERNGTLNVYLDEKEPRGVGFIR
ncbi:MAG: PEP/pyruvate-binding domain-containing protein [Planctomycetota bacterium]|jgi:hypothetical protein